MADDNPIMALCEQLEAADTVFEENQRQGASDAMVAVLGCSCKMTGSKVNFSRKRATCTLASPS
ncbi:MAG: hypothetical protein HOK21_20105 [Rhodospirillaceae bacterium]|jgi:hypothetical protein|nr:hypothetical protein [Rhodospirillaceae bacterium]